MKESIKLIVQGEKLEELIDLLILTNHYDYVTVRVMDNHDYYKVEAHMDEKK